jgi:uncharacterized membrane protein YraQ (UPF0718 family)
MSACSLLPIRSDKRKKIAIFSLFFILLSFWALSRYPDLFSEYNRVGNNTLLDRETGVLSKSAMLQVHGLQSPLVKIWHAALNWFDTNKIGMTFGFIFSAAILLLLEQSKFLFNRANRKGLGGIISGVLLGMPLGVCTNCATPVALGLKKSGASDETAFSTLIASPSLNPIGLLMIFSLFPGIVGLMRIAALTLFLFILLPIISKLCGIENKAQLTVSPENKMITDDSWISSIRYCLKRYWYYLSQIVIKVLPVMIIVGLLAALLITIFPLEHFILGGHDKVSQIVLAGLFAALLPMPMFVDIILVWAFYSVGLSLSITTTLLITLAPTSFFALYVMGKNVSWRLSIIISLSIALLGISAGLMVHHYQMTYQLANTPYKTGQHFSIALKENAKENYNNNSLSNFVGSGVSLIDFNNDGLVDVFLPGNNGNKLLKNIGNGKFSDITATSGITQQTNAVAGIWGDINNDGLADLFLVNYKNKAGQPEANKLYINQGEGKFIDLSQQYGITEKAYSASASFADFDNDGDLDLFVSNYGSIQDVDGQSIKGHSQKDNLYRNDGDSFTEIGNAAGVAGTTVKTNKLLEITLETKEGDRGFSFQPVWFDFNNDNLIDLFVTSDFGTSQLYQNLGNGRFKNVTKEKGLEKFGTAMGVEVLDFNQDGRFDLFVTTGEHNQLWINQGKGKFKDTSLIHRIGDGQRFGWGVAAIDFENSGKHALMIANGVTMHYQNVSKKLDAMSKVLNMNSFLVPNEANAFQPFNKKFRLYSEKPSRGLAIGDINNDGYLDIALSNRDREDNLILYQNSGKENASITFKLEGSRDVNRMAIGTKISLYIDGKEQHKLITAGSSYLSQHSQYLTFGVGKHKTIDKVIILWPNGKKQIMKNIPVTKEIKIKYQG